MFDDTSIPPGACTGPFVVPGTGFVPVVAPPSPAASSARHSPPAGHLLRDPALRGHYATAAVAAIPRLLGAIDRNPYSPTYGCLDRQYWHYRTASFPSGMYQEGALPLALAFATRMPGNRWFGNARLRELAVAAIRFAAAGSHADGSCDDYYPYERALGAAVFSLQAAARGYQLLELDDAAILRWLRRRADWLIGHDESGRLANHHALAALGLLRVGHITRLPQYAEAAEQYLDRVLAWQNDEGWFEEYDGADPGYQTVTIDCLAKIRRLTGEQRLDEPLRRAVAFARLFLHPDDSYGGEYGSRGTYHCYPHGFELLAGTNADAADLADGFLRALASGKQAAFDDDRMFVHRLGNLMEAYADWSSRRPCAASERPAETACYLPQAGLLVRSRGTGHTVVSAARGGVFKHFDADAAPVADTGLILETSGGRIATSQMHSRERQVELHDQREPKTDCPWQPCPSAIQIDGPLHWCRHETATPMRQAAFHAGMTLVGRWCRALVRRVLQRRLITGRRPCGIRLSRRFEFLPVTEGRDGPTLRVTDTITLTEPGLRIARMSFGSDHEAAYVAATGVYQESVLGLWRDLQPYVDQLNARRRVTLVREL